MADNSSLKVQAPYLTQYFDEVLRLSKENIEANEASMKDPELSAKLAANPEVAKAKEKEFAEKAEKILRPLIEQSFDHHDKDKNGILDMEESREFFDHFVKLHEPVKLANAEMAVRMTLERALPQMLAQMMAQVRTAYDEDTANQMERMMKDSFKEEVGPEIEKSVQVARMVIEEFGVEYQENKAARDKDAFAVIDVNGDGQLQKEEVIEGLVPGTERNKKFIAAFGYDEQKVQIRMQQIAKAEGARLLIDFEDCGDDDDD
eukprot:gnl/TRDRNA2_/TRDRNA2_43617_c0_seq1.p1 gnl/TRDRNA2_/TRDRNA2_43617_c0~~gnl/TRDRNA2_/TRDRNA2_43617_c0_seq1.p1  ORF type:complete len:261 (+),score=73.98 gnl/TRDRNA2_/TRDRNA2_43617_c0_seq1:168-950(+)